MAKLEITYREVTAVGTCAGACRYGDTFERTATVIDQKDKPRVIRCSAYKAKGGTCEPGDFFGSHADMPKPATKLPCTLLTERI